MNDVLEQWQIDKPILEMNLKLIKKSMDQHKVHMYINYNYFKYVMVLICKEEGCVWRWKSECSE